MNSIQGKLVEELVSQPCGTPLPIVTNDEINYVSCNRLAKALGDSGFNRYYGVWAMVLNNNPEISVHVPQQGSIQLMEAVAVVNIPRFMRAVIQLPSKGVTNEKALQISVNAEKFLKWWETTKYGNPPEVTRVNATVYFQGKPVYIFKFPEYRDQYIYHTSLARILNCDYKGIDDGGEFSEALHAQLKPEDVENIRKGKYKFIRKGKYKSFCDDCWFSKSLVTYILENAAPEFVAARPQIKYVINWLEKSDKSQKIEDFTYDEARIWRITYPADAYFDSANARRNFIKGKHGEAVFKRHMELKDFTLQLPEDTPDNGASTVDFETTNDKTGAISYDEIKVQARVGVGDTFYLEAVKFKRYLNYKARHGKDVFLVFICLENKTIYRAEVEDLNEQVTEGAVTFPTTAEKFGKEMVIFSVKQFLPLFELTDAEIEYIEGVSAEEQAYIDAAPIADIKTAPPEEPALPEVHEEQNMEVKPVTDTEKKVILNLVGELINSCNDYLTALKISDTDIAAVKNINADAAELLQRQIAASQKKLTEGLGDLYDKLYQPDNGYSES